LIAASSAVSRKKFKESKNTLSVYANHLSLLLLRVGRAERLKEEAQAPRAFFLATSSWQKKKEERNNTFLVIYLSYCWSTSKRPLWVSPNKSPKPPPTHTEHKTQQMDENGF
jgi:hypothetical protein